MIRKGFNLIALGADLAVVSLLRCTNIQWNRKYHEPGTFSLQIPLHQYNPEIKFIFTKDRPEMGLVSQINYIKESGYESVYLSGFFLENEVNTRIAYPSTNVTNIINNPSWVYQEGNAEDVAFAFFNGFKDVLYTDIHTPTDPAIKCLFDIEPGTNLHRGNTTRHERNGEELGSKIYQILEPSGMSYRVNYDFLTNNMMFNVWAGVDRTSEQTINNPIIFSTKYGNIKSPNVIIEDTSYKNAVITRAKYNNDNEISYVKAFIPYGVSDKKIRFLFNETALNRAEYDEDTFDDAIQNEAFLVLNRHVKVIKLEFQALPGSYVYRKDFDLGDKVSIEIPAMNISASARLIGCNEVIKQGQWTMTMEFGTPLIKK